MSSTMMRRTQLALLERLWTRKRVPQRMTILVHPVPVRRLKLRWRKAVRRGPIAGRSWLTCD